MAVALRGFARLPKGLRMSKNADTRLEETIRFIEANPAPGFVGDFAALVKALKAWKKSAPQGDLITLSGLMSQEKSANRPAKKADRAYRRAAILLKCAFEKPKDQWAAAAKLINGYSQAFADAYSYSLNDARDAYFSGATEAQVALDDLLANPINFLQNNKLTINGKSTELACSYGFSMRDGGYKFDCLSPGSAKVTVMAINVPATPYNNVKANLGAIKATLSSLDGTCKLMLTTQFTGCTYCFENTGPNLAAAHIDPQGKTTQVTGQTISKALREGGGFSNSLGGTFKAYGRVDTGSGTYGYPQTAEQMTIVAIKDNGAWAVYAQITLATHREVERIDV